VRDSTGKGLCMEAQSKAQRRKRGIAGEAPGSMYPRHRFIMRP
jgi:hypothetical protein